MIIYLMLALPLREALCSYRSPGRTNAATPGESGASISLQRRKRDYGETALLLHPLGGGNALHLRTRPRLVKQAKTS